MTLFQDAFERTMKFEGNYSNDKADPGGETYRGISRKNWPDWKGWQIIDAAETNAKRVFLDQLVERFYQEMFWTPLKCPAFPQVVANELFDTAVNVGIRPAAKLFQRALNLLNDNGKLYGDVAVDGLVGPGTITAFDSLPSKRLTTLLTVMNVLQGAYYVGLMEADEAKERWIGWFSRVGL